MSYPYYYNNGPEVEVTKREMFVSAIFAIIAFVAGICIAGSIRSCEDDANVKYYEAVQISDSTQFNYAFKTNAGHTLAYGTVEAVGFVTDDGVGNYMMLHRVLEEYRQHTRTVCTGTGKNRSCHTETYWTWDEMSSRDFSVSHVTFLGRSFYYSGFPELPKPRYVTTIDLPRKGFFSNKQRYVYYGRSLTYTGTLYANVDNHTLNDGKFLDGVPLDKAVDALIHKWGVPIFWGVFGVVIVVVIVIFVVAKNEWLYGKFWRERRRQKEEMDSFWDNMH